MGEIKLEELYTYDDYEKWIADPLGKSIEVYILEE